jgi:hypothetical protein
MKRIQNNLQKLGCNKYRERGYTILGPVIAWYAMTALDGVHV